VKPVAPVGPVAKGKAADPPLKARTTKVKKVTITTMVMSTVTTTTMALEAIRMLKEEVTLNQIVLPSAPLTPNAANGVEVAEVEAAPGVAAAVVESVEEAEEEEIAEELRAVVVVAGNAALPIKAPLRVAGLPGIRLLDLI